MPFSLFGSVKRPWVVTLGSICLVCTALLAGGFFYAGRLLAVETSPHQADVGVVLAGNFSRAVYAADLYRQKLITKVWVTKPVRESGLAQLDALGVPYPRQEDVSRAVLLKKGVPEDRIEIIGNGVVSTLAEAKLVAELLKTRPEIRHARSCWKWPSWCCSGSQPKSDAHDANIRIGPRVARLHDSADGARLHRSTDALSGRPWVRRCGGLFRR